LKSGGFIFSSRKSSGIVFIILTLVVLTTILFGRLYIRKVYPVKFKKHIIKYSEENGVDPYLVTSMIFVESKFYPKAVSKKGARGVMQIMPQTGEWVAEQIGIEDYHPDDLFDIETNIRLGTWYLAYLTRHFEGDLILVLAAYNSGQGSVRKWLKENQEPDNFNSFPFKETRAYVAKINCIYKIYKGLYNRFTIEAFINPVERKVYL